MIASSQNMMQAVDLKPVMSKIGPPGAMHAVDLDLIPDQCSFAHSQRPT
jgi:hypothetical protein